jgi:hypothetical protein
MKVDDKRIIRRENACVASRFLNSQNVVISYLRIREHENHDVVFAVSNVNHDVVFAISNVVLQYE